MKATGTINSIDLGQNNDSFVDVGLRLQLISIDSDKSNIGFMPGSRVDISLIAPDMESAHKFWSGGCGRLFEIEIKEIATN